MPQILLLAVLPDADAACLPREGTRIRCDEARVAAVRQGEDVVLSVSMAASGPSAAVAVALPVPKPATDVRLLEDAVVRGLDAHTAPRLLAITCDDLVSGSPGIARRTVVDDGLPALGDFDVAAVDSDIDSWLALHGYEPLDADPDQPHVVLHGTRAARTEGWLPTLRFRYRSAAGWLPELAPETVLVVLSDEGRGRLEAIGEVEPQASCLVNPADFDATVDKAIDDAFGDTRAQAIEYAWTGADCAPCAAPAPTQGDLADLGFIGTLDDLTLTRLRLRDAPAARLKLVDSPARRQLAFLENHADIQGIWPVCGGPDEITHDASFCEPDPEDEAAPDAETQADPLAQGGSGCRCNGTPGPSAGWLLLLLGLRRRIERRS